MGNEQSVGGLLRPGQGLPANPAQSQATEELVARCKSLLANSGEAAHRNERHEAALADACTELFSCLSLLTGVTMLGPQGPISFSLPEGALAGVASLFCDLLPAYFAAPFPAGGPLLTPAALRLLETQLSVLYWRRELGLAQERVAAALATLLPAAQRGLSGPELEPGKALELRARLLTLVACAAADRRGRATTAWKAEVEGNPAAAEAAVLLACDVCSSLPTQEDVALRFGLHSGDDARSLANDLDTAQAVLMACNGQCRQMVKEGRLGLREAQSLSTAAVKVLKHASEPFEPSPSEAEAFANAAVLLDTALAIQAACVHSQPLLSYTAAQGKHWVEAYWVIASLLARLADAGPAGLAFVQREMQQTALPVWDDFGDVLASTQLNFNDIFDHAARMEGDSGPGTTSGSGLLPDGEAVGWALAAVEAMMRTATKAFMSPANEDEAKQWGTVEFLILRGPYTRLHNRLVDSPLLGTSGSSTEWAQVQALVMSAVKLRRSDVGKLRAHVAHMRDRIDDPEDLLDSDLLSCLDDAGCLLERQPSLLEGRDTHLTRHLQQTGFLAFAVIPALLLSSGDGSMDAGRKLIRWGESNSLLDEFVRAGLIQLLCQDFTRRMGRITAWESAAWLGYVADVCADPDYSSLALGVVKGGLLSAALDWAEQGLHRSSGRSQLPYLAAARLLRVLCASLDASSGSSLCSGQRTPLLQGIPATPFRAADLRGADLRVPWARRFQRQPAYQAVRSTLLPALEALCTQLTEDSREQDAIFREVAVSAVSCTFPGCVNVGGTSEAALKLRRCARCSCARYCCRHDQRQDWPRHAPICTAIAQLKS